MQRFTLLALAAACLSVTLAQRPAKKICLNSDAAADLCSEIIGPWNAAQSDVTFSCFLAEDGDCTNAVKDGNADLTILGARDTYSANKRYGLEAIAAEDDGKGSTEYISVAVVRKEMCDANPRLRIADLKGKDACFTGYQRTAGWVMPLGKLLYDKTIPLVSDNATIQNDAESVAAFFGDVCAPRVINNGPQKTLDGKGTTWEGLCTACAGDCTTNDPYHNYIGAYKCFEDGKGEVMFTKQESPRDYAQDGTAPLEGGKLRMEDMRLLCPTGGCKRLDEYEQCSFARVPNRAVVVRPDTDDVDAIIAGLDALTTIEEIQSTVFNETANPQELLFTPTTKVLRPITNGTMAYLGPRAIAAFEGFDELTRPTTRMCVNSKDASALCSQVIDSLNEDQSYVTFECFLAEDGSCTNAVAEGDADMAILGARDTYVANKNNGLIAIAAEDDGKGGTEYISVAVVKKEMCDANPNLTVADLKGKNACFTGYQRTAGWIMPVGKLLYDKTIPLVSNNSEIQNDAESVAAFFGKVCAPRAINNGPMITRDGKGNTWKELCEQCAGDCTTNDPYHNYIGAYKCFEDGKGDVMFTKQEAPRDYAQDGTVPLEGGKLKKDDMRLLCPTGGCKKIDEYEQCSFARVPNRAVVVRPNTVDIPRLLLALEAVTQNEAFQANVFNETANTGELLFSPSTIALVPISNTTAYLGPRAIAAFQGFDELSETLSSAGRRRY